MRYLIQIANAPRLPKRSDFDHIIGLLEGTGIELDLSYGPVVIDRKQKKVVVRGTATEEAKAKAEEIPGVTLFADLKGGPA
jgi:hypothetical protein